MERDPRTIVIDRRTLMRAELSVYLSSLKFSTTLLANNGILGHDYLQTKYTPLVCGCQAIPISAMTSILDDPAIDETVGIMSFLPYMVDHPTLIDKISLLEEAGTGFVEGKDLGPQPVQVVIACCLFLQKA